MSDILYLYTEGSCITDKHTGGWAAVLEYKTAYKEIDGVDLNATNNKMELLAIIEALNAVKIEAPIYLHCNSHYVMCGILQWIEQWKQNNWLTAKKEPVKNKELWKTIDEFGEILDIHWVWVGKNQPKQMVRAKHLARQKAQSV